MLIGYAGTGKTTLMQAFVAQALDRGLRVCACAPTHKAVDVIAGKMREARIEVECRCSGYGRAIIRDERVLAAPEAPLLAEAIYPRTGRPDLPG